MQSLTYFFGPCTFRSSYDPNPKIAASMTNILNSLVADPKELTSADSPYFAPIMKDLIENMFNKQVRQALRFPVRQRVWLITLLFLFSGAHEKRRVSRCPIC